MSASADDYFHKVGRSTATTLSAPGYTVGNASINVASTTNWPTSTGVTFAIDETDSDGNRVAGTYNVFRGTVSGATQVNNLTYVGGDANRDYSAASTTRVYILVSSYRDNRFTDGILVEHNQDGTHSDVTADSIVVTGDVTAANFIQSGGSGADGWTVGLPAVSSVTALGNRSYTMVMASDVSATLSEGMRLRATRTVASTQNAFSLDGSNDYYNDTTVSGMTFTDDFSVSAWVYCTAYQQSGIVSRRAAGGSGWMLYMAADGTIILNGCNTSTANFRRVVSYQSIPLNKWVHISAQLDMSTYTATPTTCYVMIDGVNVPASVAQGGTNPTTLIQAGNLEIGSYDGGGNPFSGYLDQVAIYSAKVTQATHLAAMHQGLTGSETSLISAYANGSTTDLSANANNLTAQNGATTVASAPWGNRGLSTTLDYELVMAVSGANVTVQVPEGCTIPTSGGITSVAYSTQANPYGWVSDKGRWEIKSNLRTTSATTSNATYGAFLNGGYRLTIPKGKWQAGHKSGSFFNRNVSMAFCMHSSALTGLTVEQANAVSPFTVQLLTSAAASMVSDGQAEAYIDLSAEQTYTMYTFGASTTAGIDGASSQSEIYATPSSL